MRLLAIAVVNVMSNVYPCERAFFYGDPIFLILIYSISILSSDFFFLLRFLLSECSLKLS